VEPNSKCCIPETKGNHVFCSSFGYSWLFQEIHGETHASRIRTEVMLMQEGQPSAYISKPFAPRNQAVSAYEKELLINLSLKCTLEQKNIIPFQSQWLPQLMGYHTVYGRTKKMLLLIALLESLVGSWWRLLCLRLKLTYFIKCKLVGKWQQNSQIQDIIAATNTYRRLPISILIKLT